MNASLDVRYTSTLGVAIELAVRVPADMLAGGDGAHLSPRDARDVIDRAGRNAMPRLAAMVGAMLEQAQDAVQDACVESLRLHARDHTVPLATDLAPAGRGEP